MSRVTLSHRTNPLSLYSCTAALSSAKQEHLQGPLDGSLYATILKSPKSRRPPSVILSPPPEFGHSSALNPYSKSHLSGSTQSLQVYPTSSHYSTIDRQHHRQLLSPTPYSTLQRGNYSPSLASTVAESVQFQRAFSTPPQEIGTINHNKATTTTINHHHHQQQHLRQNQPSGSRQQRSTPQQFVQEIRIVEEFQRPETGRAGGGGGGKSAIAKLGGNARDSLNLSMSMDSGISSSGLQQVHHSK